MNLWKIILATLVIFGTGVITGGLLVTYSESALQHARRAANAESARHPGHTNETRQPPALTLNLRKDKDFLGRLDREVKLSPDQLQRIQKLIATGQERIKEISKQTEPRIHAELQQTREHIREVLTPQQQIRYAELLRRHPNPAHSGTNPVPRMVDTNFVPLHSP